MYKLLKISIAIVLLIALTAVFAFDMSDIQGAKIVRYGECTERGKEYPCAVLTKDSKFYMAVVDDKGLYKVYKLATLQDRYELFELDLVWQRRGKDDT